MARRGRRDEQYREPDRETQERLRRIRELIIIFMTREPREDEVRAAFDYLEWFYTTPVWLIGRHE